MPNYFNKNSTIPKMNNYFNPCKNCSGATATQYMQAVQPTTQMPTGIPTGPAYSSPTPVQQVPSTPIAQAPSTPIAQAPLNGDVLLPETVLSTAFTQGYLRTQIGRHVKVEFLIGTNMFVDREGILMDVGTSYIIIRETETDDLLLCDMYSIKFVRFFY